jgi:hypothetical protein
MGVISASRDLAGSGDVCRAMALLFGLQTYT